MANIANTFNVKGTNVSIQDDTARNTAASALSSAEYDRQMINEVYAGQNLETLFADEIKSYADVWRWLQARIKAANYSGIRIGDYINCTTSEGTNIPSQTKKLYIGAIDRTLNVGDTADGHSIDLVPDSPWLVQGAKAVNTSYIHWKDTDNNNGTSDEHCPYYGSKLRGWEISDLKPALPAGLQAILKNHRILVEERYSSSGTITSSASWAWRDSAGIYSPSEVEVYGFPVWGTVGYSVGADCPIQLIACDTHHRLFNSRVTRWLRSVPAGSSSAACYCNFIGNANHYSCTHGWVRPFSCFHVG